MGRVGGEGFLPIERGLQPPEQLRQWVDSLLKAANGELDPAKRASLLQRADAIMATQVPMVPMWQRPVLLIHRSDLRGLLANPSGAAVWNIEDWHWNPKGTWSDKDRGYFVGDATPGEPITTGTIVSVSGSTTTNGRTSPAIHGRPVNVQPRMHSRNSGAQMLSTALLL